LQLIQVCDERRLYEPRQRHGLIHGRVLDAADEHRRQVDIELLLVGRLLGLRYVQILAS